jgi:hypothetical protein
MKYIGLFLLVVAFDSCKGGAHEFYPPGFRFSLFANSPVSQLADAVNADDTASIRNLIATGKPDVNYQEPKFGNSLLTLAVVDYKPLATKMLLEFGANPNLRSPHSNLTPFIAACRYGGSNRFNDAMIKWRDLLALLIDRGAEVNDTTAFGYVLGNGTLDIVKLFPARGARLDIYPKDGYKSILVRALYNLNVLRYLLIDKGVPIPAYAVVREEGTVNEKN